jgi:hypothetical protein
MEVLIGLIGTVSGNIVRETAQAELSRRVKAELASSSAAASAQTQTLIGLTWALFGLTLLLASVGAVQAMDGYSAPLVQRLLVNEAAARNPETWSRQCCLSDDKSLRPTCSPQRGRDTNGSRQALTKRTPSSASLAPW